MKGVLVHACLLTEAVPVRGNTVFYLYSWQAGGLAYLHTYCTVRATGFII